MLIQHIVDIFLAAISTLELFYSMLNDFSHLGGHLLAQGLDKLRIHLLLGDLSLRYGLGLVNLRFLLVCLLHRLHSRA